MDRHFAQRVAVVTGGSSGIGEAIARSVIQAGARVAILDLKENPAISPSLFIHCDVRDSGSVRATFQEVAERLGPVEFLVNTAGVVSEALLEEMDEKEWDRVVETSLKGTFLCCQAATRQMRPRRFGRIVNFSSGYAVKGYRRGSHYAAAKAGIIALTKSLALEVAAEGINVNAVAPGPVDTPLLRHLGDEAFLAEWRRATARVIPKGRIGVPEDVVGPTLFLLGAESEYVTGQTIHVNGGMTLP